MNAGIQPFLPTGSVPTPAVLGMPSVALEGRWEGNIGKGVLLLDLRPDGTASINLKRRVRTVYHPCSWNLVGDMIHLICSADQAVTFPILSVSENTLILRMGIDSPDACQLQRIHSHKSLNTLEEHAPTNPEKS